MEFTINCPVDGAVEVGLEDIDAVVLRDSERADITFVCPDCGTRITISAIVPAFLMAAMQALAEDSEAGSITGLVVLTSDDGDDEVSSAVVEDSRADAYCEYFRRQLDRVECVDDALSQMDSSPRAPY